MDNIERKVLCITKGYERIHTDVYELQPGMIREDEKIDKYKVIYMSPTGDFYEITYEKVNISQSGVIRCKPVNVEKVEL